MCWSKLTGDERGIHTYNNNCVVSLVRTLHMLYCIYKQRRWYRMKRDIFQSPTWAQFECWLNVMAGLDERKDVTFIFFPLSPCLFSSTSPSDVRIWVLCAHRRPRCCRVYLHAFECREWQTALQAYNLQYSFCSLQIADCSSRHHGSFSLSLNSTTMNCTRLSRRKERMSGW